MPVNLSMSDGSIKSSKSSLKSLKGTLKCKASKLIKAITPKKKKKVSAGDMLSLSSSEESDNGNGNKNSTSTGQPEVIEVDDNDRQSDNATEEDAEAELGKLFFYQSGYENTNISITEQLKKDWNAPIYAFFEPTPDIKYEKGRRFHAFLCAGTGCKREVCRYLDKSDATSTSNL